METGVLLTLVVLALVDSTSFGTLLIPVWLLLSPRLQVGRMLTYLGTVAGFYFVIGAVLVLGAGQAREVVAGVAATEPFLWAQLAVGVGLFALSFRYTSKQIAARNARRDGPDRIQRFQQKVRGPDATATATVTLGVGAAGIELASMLPYLAAIGLITAAGLTVPQWLPVLAGYVLVMVLPALALLVVRVVAQRRVEPVLERISAWMSKHTASALGWILAIVGFLVARDAVGRLIELGALRFG